MVLFLLPLVHIPADLDFCLGLDHFCRTNCVENKGYRFSTQQQLRSQLEASPSPGLTSLLQTFARLSALVLQPGHAETLLVLHSPVL